MSKVTVKVRTVELTGINDDEAHVLGKYHMDELTDVLAEFEESARCYGIWSEELDRCSVHGQWALDEGEAFFEIVVTKNEVDR